jgi:SAM-dependent methyltransferase
MHPDDHPSAECAIKEYSLHRNAVDDPGYRGFLRRLADPLCEVLPESCSGLDYGCGPGPALAAMLVERGHRMAVYDPLFVPHAEVLQARYDFVTCSEVAEHFVDPRAEFQRLRELLRPGGTLAVMTQWRRDEAPFAQWRYVHDPTHVCFYRERSFSWIASWLGMELRIPSPNIALLRRP